MTVFVDDKKISYVLSYFVSINDERVTYLSSDAHHIWVLHESEVILILSKAIKAPVLRGNFPRVILIDRTPQALLH